MSHDGPTARPAISTAAQATVEHLEADTVSLETSVARKIQANTVVTHLSAMVNTAAHDVQAQGSAIAAQQAHRVDMRFSAIGAALAAQVSASRSALGFVASREVQANDRTYIGLLLTPQIKGNVRPLLDWRAAIVLGVVLGLIIKLTTRKSHDSPLENR